MRLRERFNLLRGMYTLALWQDAQLTEWKKLNLDHARSGRDMVLAWRVSLESPEVDIRDEVDALVTEWSDQVARLEEEVVA